MTKTTTITINGRLYDAVTGMPVTSSGNQAPHKPSAPAGQQAQPKVRAFSDIGPRPAAATLAKPAPRPVGRPAHPDVTRGEHPGANAMHKRLQKSDTLYRKALKKPVPKPVSASISSGQLPGRSPLISRFGKNITVHPELARKARAKEAEEPIAPAQIHPTVAKIIQQHHTAPITEQPATGKELKEQLIKERLASVSDTPAKQKKRGLFKRTPRMAAILTSSLALLILGGYLTYMNLPVISMKVAASRAGVEATFPNYRPDGYGLNGPITYSPGEVNINYKSNTSDSSFKITQKPSNWDSQGLLDNFVTKQAANYLTFQERGITVYTFGNKAAWMNGGILYTLDGSASLSSDQVLRLATSM